MYDLLKNCKTLELPLILNMLSSLASMPDAKEMALNIKPDNNIDNVAESIALTEDAYILMAKYSSPSFSGTPNIVSPLNKARLGASLSARELLDIGEALKTVRSVKSWRENNNAKDNRSIDRYFETLSPNKYIEDKIYFAIKSEDEISDNASPELASIRRKISQCSSKIRDNLEKIVRGSTAKYLQDAIITQRDGRFVVPVKIEYRSEIKGIVHDTSSSGSTLFVEPMSVVETNNEIRVLKLKEQDEIARILFELSADVGGFADSIEMSYKALTVLNLIFAKARLAVNMKASVPKINSNGFVMLKNARHPLIDKHKVVPISLSLGGDFDTLIITGPNTGGKTVTLKTVGLLCLMAMCGLMIPADDNSEIAVFDMIYADIGDEQSIEQSLSTFSSHMVNIVSILKDCNENSLVLFDELCAGTDPIEGAALAKSILIELNERHTKCVATTHYSELKSYAIDGYRVENASCEFDIETLKPTYKLIIGIPGRSNAFAISSRLGLDEHIISNASNQLSDDDLRFERVVSSLEQARKSAEEERETAERLRIELAENKKITENLQKAFRKEQEDIINRTKSDAQRIIEDARYKSDLLLNELEDIKKKINAENAANLMNKAKHDTKRLLNNLEDTSNPVEQTDSTLDKLTKLPKKNDIVVIASLNQDATVIDVDEKTNRVNVVSGALKLWTSIDNLRIKKSAVSTENKKTRRVTGMISRAERNVSGELDIRGFASDEAIMELDKYIDNAILSGISVIRIIHGKGTGVLRTAVREYLKKSRYVKSSRLGTFGEGEDGVSIVTLK